MYKILSLDGGGIRGIISAVFLQEVEELLYNHYNIRLHEYFDLVAGTSTGSIIAAGIAVEKSADEIINLYINNGNDIFFEDIRDRRKIYWYKFISSSIFFFNRLISSFALYPHERNNRGLINVLKDVLGPNRRISDIQQPILFIPAYDVLSRNTTWFASNPNGTSAWFSNLELWKICVSSASAPTFFPPYPLPIPNNNTSASENNSQELGHIDGGVSANNPSLSAISHVLETTTHTLQDIALLSIGCGLSTKRFKSQEIKKWGSVQWAKNIPNMFLAPGAENSEKICKKILNSVNHNNHVNYLRLNFRLNKELEGRYNRTVRDFLSEPYNEYLMQKYIDRYNTDKYIPRNESEQLNDNWLEDEKYWVRKLQYVYNKKFRLKEDIDDPELCPSLIEATIAYINYNINNSNISVREQINNFIINNPPNL
ncbi:MAG: patatin-like phospholipase family protein [Prochloraceae cyanobacterium]|nr:patatin-like phospholipase family protein [Prochloraceae cyanobacterium]